MGTTDQEAERGQDGLFMPDFQGPSIITRHFGATLPKPSDNAALQAHRPIPTLLLFSHSSRMTLLFNDNSPEGHWLAVTSLGDGIVAANESGFFGL